MEKISLRVRQVCPHCDGRMDLVYLNDVEELRFICTDGCKAEYLVSVKTGPASELPVCGAKRVSTTD